MTKEVMALILGGGQGTRGARLEEHTCEKKPDLPAHVASEKNGAP